MSKLTEEIREFQRAVSAMPPWPVPYAFETEEHYVNVTLAYHGQDMDAWRAEFGHLFEKED